MELDADLVVVGGGPAGCAAAIMASSLGLRTILVEPQRLCHKLESIASVANVLGYSTGTQIAARAVEDMSRLPNCALRLGRRVDQLHADDTAVAVTTDRAETIRAAYAVVATGVRPRLPAESDWIAQDQPTRFKALWEATADELADVEVLVLGIDRPLGTVLRTHAALRNNFLVLYGPAEAYKADEVREDPRVVLLPTSHLDLIHDRTGLLHLCAVSDDGERVFVGRHVYLNLGSHPVRPDGDVVADRSGYCPPERQHPRILVAGDLRGARYQRIMTAFGSGADAALKTYYALNEVT